MKARKAEAAELTVHPGSLFQDTALNCGLEVGAGDEGRGDSGTLPHPLNARASTQAGIHVERLPPLHCTEEMIWLAIEMLLGFAVFAFLVWWTWPKKDKR